MNPRKSGQRLTALQISLHSRTSATVTLRSSLTKAGTLHGATLIPLRRLESYPSKKGHIKVKLHYTTEEPKHIRSYILSRTYGVKGPFFEDVCVLIPQAEVYPELSWFVGVFTRLQFNHVISGTAQLKNFSLLDEDNITLAYVLD